MKKALVTGATGFIGGHLVRRLLREGILVRALVRPTSSVSGLPAEVEIVEGDVGDEQSLSRAVQGIDTVFHLAGKAHALSEIRQDEGVYHSLIVEGTKNLLEASKKHAVKTFIFFSSVKAMGESTSGCFDEDADPFPRTAYGRSKLNAERLTLSYKRHTSMRVMCLRLPLVYGPGNRGNLFRMIRMIDRGLFPPLPDLHHLRSMVHVANVAEAAILAATTLAADGRIYIVTDDRAYSTAELYEKISRSLGRSVPGWHIPLWTLKTLGYLGDAIGRFRRRKFPIDSDAVEKLLGEAWYSSQKISRELGYQPVVSFDSALPELVDWCKKALR